ncbi:MAG: carboxyl-terminal processing protease, partial [Bacteroidota bacterium]|nr:carboxyl-terminal processing protease [Bacteroidota bacterium]
IQRPYKNKEEYRDLVGRLDLEEGYNIEHNLANIEQVLKKEHKNLIVTKKEIIIINDTAANSKKKIENDTLPIFKTKSGRTVLGGGGITPDYVIMYDTITKPSRQVLNKDLFLEFTNTFMEHKGNMLKSKFKDNFNNFLFKFDIDDEILGEFKKFTESKGVEWKDEEFKTDKKYLKTMLKSNLARSVWDRNKYLQIYFTDDKMVNKAKGLFPEAAKVAKLR